MDHPTTLRGEHIPLRSPDESARHASELLTPPLLSLLVPVRNEAAALAAFLAHLQRLPSCPEVVVVDGESHDDTMSIAHNHAVVSRLLRCGGGRHVQLNHGLAAANGTWVLCLPVDARLTSTSLARLQQHLLVSRPVAGCLTRHASNRAALHRWLDTWATIRTTWTRGAYMDQLPFFHRRTALAAGFRNVGPYDSSNLGRRLAQVGTFVQARVPVAVSCRAYRRHGIFPVTLHHQRLRLVHFWRNL
ncbi:MAG: glycosyltransferase [Planctomycetes bacterium]|nr:glycosyltransferase [Planctomycetota bacterium]